MKKIARVITSIMFALSMGVATAADNSIYIDQSGDTSTVSVTQDGAGNVVRGIQGVGTGNTTPAKIYGDGTLVSVSQIGSGSTLNLGIVSTIAAGARIIQPQQQQKCLGHRNSVLHNQCTTSLS